MQRFHRQLDRHKIIFLIGFNAKKNRENSTEHNKENNIEHSMEHHREHNRGNNSEYNRGIFTEHVLCAE